MSYRILARFCMVLFVMQTHNHLIQNPDLLSDNQTVDDVETPTEHDEL